MHNPGRRARGWKEKVLGAGSCKNVISPSQVVARVFPGSCRAFPLGAPRTGNQQGGGWLVLT